MKTKTKKIWMPRRFWSRKPQTQVKASKKIYDKNDRRLNKII